MAGEAGSDPICIFVPYVYYLCDPSNYGYSFSSVSNFNDFSDLGYNFWGIPNLYHL